MKLILILMIGVLVLSSVYAQNIDVSIYQEDEEFGKIYGNIDAKPGENIEAYIQVENDNKNNDNKDEEYDNIEVYLTIDGILSGIDYEKEFDDFDLKAREKEDLRFEVEVPLRIEEQTFNIIAELEGKENIGSFAFNEDFLLNVVKEGHNVLIRKAEFTDYKCGEEAILNLDLLNIGKDDEEVLISIRYSNKEIRRKALLEKYPGRDIFSEVYPFKLEEGVYGFEIEISYSGLGKITYAEIDTNCKEEQEKEVSIEEEKEETQEIQNVAIYKQPKVTKIEESKGSSWILIILGVLIVIAVVIILILKRK